MSTVVTILTVDYTGPFTSGAGTVMSPEALTASGAALLNAAENTTIDAGKITVNELTGSKITADTITATQIAANSITANEINVSSLSAVSADLGTVTAGTIEGGSIPDANSAPAGAETGSYFDLTGGKFTVGNATNNILFDGTDLSVTGDIITTGNIKTSCYYSR